MTPPFERILLASDGSDAAEAATRHAATLAAATGATIHMVHVVDESNAENALHQDERVRDAEEQLQAVATELRAKDVPVEVAVRPGRPAAALLAYAEEHDVDLAVVGATGRTGLSRYLLGSVAQRVIRGADIPVLTVPKTEASPLGPYRRVLVATDGSRPSMAALDLAVDLVRSLDARLHVDPAPVGLDVRHDAIVDVLQEHAKEVVHDAERRARTAGVETVTSAVVTGVPHRRINEYVADNDVDLVAMGTHGRSGLDRQLLGSVTEKVVRTSEVPVLTVRGGR